MSEDLLVVLRGEFVQRFFGDREHAASSRPHQFGT
jgi:hypothetical protein